MGPDAGYITLVAAVSATWVSVALYFYLAATRRLGQWYVRWCWQSIRDVRPLGRGWLTRHFSRGLGVIAVSGWRIVLACYLAVIAWLVVPSALTLAALSLSSHLIQP